MFITSFSEVIKQTVKESVVFLGMTKVLIFSIKEETNSSYLIHCLTWIFVPDSIFQTMKLFLK